jgi:DNA processing protein
MNIYDIAYNLLDPNVGQKYIKEKMKKGGEFRSCPNSFKESLLKDKISLIPFWDSRYPFLLKQIADYPPILFAKGDLSLLEKTCVTIVGSRKISKYSFKVLEKFFKEKKKFKKDICFVSGLANGVDFEVHRLCLKNNLPTIGVVGGGLDKVYYKGNSVMYNYLSKYRLVLAEFPPNRKFFKGMFPLRNRILAGISKKTFVIQAAERSGALNTASHANNYGRDVFAIPSGIFSESNQGCLNLISQGANVVLNINDFVEKI